eukprot:TRINITY_DN2402_c0_g4_i1.p1 TRINITY_DN2402_c0_g4~~TRINITY_DN2402_c0_g4_i1.p1  ORF type:complete len:204 (-),score=84.98 TRINITY_DN2402_c0_g4_i1:180-791(-)
MYTVHQRVAEQCAPVQPKPRAARPAAAGFSFGGVAAAACSSEEEEEEDWSGSESEGEPEEWQPVGGQLNCWLQLNDKHLALPSLGFLPKHAHAPITQICEQQPVFEQQGSERVCSEIKQVLRDSAAHVLLHNKRGVALVWDAKRTWHSAVWLDQAKLQHRGVTVSAQGRDSVELRFHVLEEAQVTVYLRVLLQELCTLLSEDP